MTTFRRAGPLAAAAFLCTVLSGSGRAQDYKVGDLLIKHPWSRASPAGAKVAAGYLSIVNSGTLEDHLTGGTLQAATGFEVHFMATVNGVMTMRATGPLAIPAGATVTLAPTGQHIMFTGLKYGLKQGTTVDGTLIFERAGTVPVHFVIDSIGAKSPSSAKGDAMPGMTMQ